MFQAAILPLITQIQTRETNGRAGDIKEAGDHLEIGHPAHRGDVGGVLELVWVCLVVPARRMRRMRTVHTRQTPPAPPLLRLPARAESNQVK